MAGPSGYALSHTLLGHTAPVSVVRYSPSGELLASAGADGKLNLWNARTGQHVRGLDGHKGRRKGINDLAWSADSRLIATASDDKTIRIWSVEAGKPVHARLKGHTAAVVCLAFNPQGNLLASGGQDESLIVWDVRQGLAHHTISAHSDPITGVDFNRDGTLIVSASWDGLIRLWDTATGQCLKTLVHEVSVPIAGISFVPNGKFILSTTLDSTARLWTYQTGRCVKTYGLPAPLAGGVRSGGEKVGCRTAVWARPRGREGEESWIVGGTEEGRVIAWDLQSRKVVLDLGKTHNHCIISVAPHPTLPLLATASISTDYTIKIYALAPDSTDPTFPEPTSVTAEAADTGGEMTTQPEGEDENEEMDLVRGVADVADVAQGGAGPSESRRDSVDAAQGAIGVRGMDVDLDGT